MLIPMSVPIFITVFLVLHGGFYLGYLRGRIFPQNAQLPAPPPPNILLSLQYISNYVGKIIQTWQGQCTWSKYSVSKDCTWQETWLWLKKKIKYHCNISQNCLKMHQTASQPIFISKNFQGGGWACPRTPLGSSWPLATRDFSPKQ